MFTGIITDIGEVVGASTTLGPSPPSISYSNCHPHWKPVTVTCSASSGGSASSRSVPRSAMTNTTATSASGIAV